MEGLEVQCVSESWTGLLFFSLVYVSSFHRVIA